MSAHKTTMNPLPPPPPHWVLDLNSAPESKAKSTSIPDPPGYSQGSASKGKVASSKQPQGTIRKPASADELDTLKMKKAWELAIAPAKSLPMSAVGMYMAGSSLQIFSIFMLFQLFKSPLQAISNTNATFVRLESDGTKSKMWAVKILYILANCLTLALGIYKINTMGLLPYVVLWLAFEFDIWVILNSFLRTTRSDWLAWETARTPLERAYPESPY